MSCGYILVTDHAVGNQVYTNEQSDAVDLKDSQSDNDDNDEEDDDELFCDSLGPELSEEEKVFCAVNLMILFYD